MIPEVNKALDDIATAAFHMEQAQQELEAAIPRTPTEAELSWLYWEVPRLNTTVLANAIGAANQHELRQLISPKASSVACAICGQILWANSRAALKEIEKPDLRFEPTCAGCKEEYRERRHAAYAAEDAARDARLRELREMSYGAYLQTPEWDATRRAALRRAYYRCQACNADRPLQVHHRTYERLGEEFARDLIALCGPCHKTFHAKRQLARTDA